MIYGENQNRQFYVVDATNTATLKIANGSAYIKLAADEVSTDKMRKGMIRDIRISKPLGASLKEWAITMPSTIVSGEDYYINMEFRNWMGFGNNDNYLKFAVAHSTSTTASELATKFAGSLKRAFDREAIKPFSLISAGATGTVGGVTGNGLVDGTVKSISVVVASAGSQAVAGSLNTTTGVLTVTLTPSSTASDNTPANFNTMAAAATITNHSSYKVSDYYKVLAVGTTASASATALSAAVILRERDEKITKSSILRGVTRLPISLTIGLDSTDTDHPWADSNVAVSIWKQYSNAEVIADMEYFFMKGRADMYGYMGFPNINPSEMRVDPEGTSDYYVLDIKYFFQEHGMLNQNSEKEITLVCTTKATLENLVYNSGAGIISSTTGTSLSGDNRDVEIYAVSF